MYNDSKYKETSKESIISFMQLHPFVLLIGAYKNGRTEATQVPVLVEEREGKIFITGHVAKRSGHQEALEDNPLALVVFTGPHVYISGTWYTGNLQQASTWNYISVHARGHIRWTAEEELIEILRKLSLHFEKGNTASSTIYDNLPEEYLSKLVKAIVGFEIEVSELDNVHKLSQNRDEKSYDNIVKELKQQEGDGKLIGEIMEKSKSKIFP